jgi:hypothetical protein
MSLDTLLARLDGVRQTGTDRWMCKCPAHGDRTPSLSVRRADDGTILIHCFVGCSAEDVLAAVGMGIRDLFPRPLGHRLQKKRSGISPYEVMRALRREILIVELLAEDIACGIEPTPEYRQRAKLAAERIDTALSLCNG